MPRTKDLLWEHILQDGRKVKCKFCEEVFVGGVTRMRYHFANTCSKDIRPCKFVPDLVRDLALKGVQELEAKSKRRKSTRFPKSFNNSSGSILQSGDANADALQVYYPNPKATRTRKSAKSAKPAKTFSSSTRRPEQKEADKAIVKYIVNSNLTFDVLKSPEFREACIRIANAGPGYEPPSSDHFCRKLLAELKDEANVHVHCVKRLWEKSGCSLMLDTAEGMDVSHVHLLAASPKGVVYLKSLPVAGHATGDHDILDFISSVIDEIGPQNVVQFISDNPKYESIGHMIEFKYPNIFTVKCARHCIALVLKELNAVEGVYSIFEDARKIFNFLHKHPEVWNLVRNRANRSKLKRPGATRVLMNISYLQSILDAEHVLRYIASTAEWRDLQPCKTVEGTEVETKIKDRAFWDCAKKLMHAVKPLVKMLRMVDCCGSTSGYIYNSIHKAKEAVKEAYGDDTCYMQFSKIIDDQWGNLYCEIHAAAAYLNPHLFHDGRVKLDPDIKVGLEKVIQRMVSNNEDRTKIAAELRDYHSLDPRIFGIMAVDSLHVSHPRIWWDMWGGSVPILQSLAVKLLSQPCSFLTCQKNSNASEATFTKNLDHSESRRFNDLLYVRMNMHLMNSTPKTEKFDVKPIDVDKIDIFPDEIEETSYEQREDADDKEGEVDESENEAFNQSDLNRFPFS